MFDPGFGAMLLVLAAWLTAAPPMPRANTEAVVRMSFRTFTSNSARSEIAALSLPTPPVPAGSRAIPYCSNLVENPAIVERHEPRTHRAGTALARLRIVAESKRADLLAPRPPLNLL